MNQSNQKKDQYGSQTSQSGNKASTGYTQGNQKQGIQTPSANQPQQKGKETDRKFDRSEDASEEE